MNTLFVIAFAAPSLAFAGYLLWRSRPTHAEPAFIWGGWILLAVWTFFLAFVAAILVTPTLLIGGLLWAAGAGLKRLTRGEA